MKLLIKLATRERPHKAVNTIRSFATMATGSVSFLVSVDEDDRTLNIPALVCAAGSQHISIVKGRSLDKIDAINRDIQGRAFDVLLVIADDMVPVVRGYDQIILEHMLLHFPDMDGALWFDDGNQHDKLCTLPIMGRKLYDALGYVYHPDYRSLYADDEYTAVLKRADRIVYIARCIIRHDHPFFTKKPYDALLKRTESFRKCDRMKYREREQAGFPGVELQPLPRAAASVS